MIIVKFISVCHRDGQGPCHLAAAWGLDSVLETLLEYNADINAQVYVDLVHTADITQTRK